ncbi:MAG: thiamine-phosphate kinase [Burkholderiales bacterium]|nr:thiamine-phosphate kinase [Burkholderiales bacterium]
MLSEFELVRRYFGRGAPSALLGVGDDAAILAPTPGAELAFATDLLLEGRHFRAHDDPRALGHKALAVNLSDMAAMGARPRWALLAIALPEADEAWLAAFADGLYALAARFGVDLVGGDTTRGPRTLCVAILGEVPAGQALTRAGARPGDDVWVSGNSGVRRSRSRARARQTRTRRAGVAAPEPRVSLGERLRALASSAIDVSDGFAQDLGHILEASGVCARVRYEALPRHPALERPGVDEALRRRCVLAGGDDYELVFTAAPAARAAIEEVGRALGVRLSRVGTIERGAPQLAIVDARGAPIEPPRGFDHFAA